MALDHNVDLNADRLDPQISDTRVAAAAGVFRPTFNSSVQPNNQLQPPSSFLIPIADAHRRRDVERRRSASGCRGSARPTTSAWTPSHTDSNSFLNSYNPLLQSGLSLSVSQPLIRDLSIDAARQQLATSRINRDIADTRLRESLVHTTANVKSAYWNLVSAQRERRRAHSRRSTSRRSSCASTRPRSTSVQSPPLDLVSAQAEVAVRSGAADHRARRR